MKVIKGVSCPEKCDVRARAMKWLEEKKKYKDVRDGRIYEVDRYYKNHVAMINEFGFRKCFQYSEIIWGLA